MAFGFLGSRAIWDPDEGRYTEVALEMAASGNWVYPTLHGVPHFTKPPLTYWSIAAGMAALGQNEWGARLYDGVAFAATILVLAALGQALARGPGGRWAGIVYATMLFPFAAAGIVTADTLLTLFVVASCASFWWGWSSSAASRPAAYAMWAALGLAFLTKGPPGLLPLLVVVPFALLAREAPARGRWSWIRPGPLAVFAVLAFPWYALAVHGAPGLLHYFTEDEFIRRVATAAHHRNPQWYKPFEIYLPVLTLGVLPWSAFWPAALRRAPTLRRLRDRPGPLLLTLWIVLPLLLFSLVKSRQSLYVLPILPALALATALGFRPGRQRRRVAVAVIAAVALLALRFASSRLDHARDARTFADWLRPWIEERGTEVVIVDRDAHGVDFYLDVPVELARWGTDDGMRFRALDSVVDELVELPTTSYRHLFVVEQKRVASLAARIREAGLEPSLGGERYGERIVVVDPADGERGTLRGVALVWEDPGSELDRLDRARGIKPLIEELAPVEVVVLRDPAGSSARVPGHVDEAGALWQLREYGVPLRVCEVEPGREPAQLRLEDGVTVSVRASDDALDVVSGDGQLLGRLTVEAPVAWIELRGPTPRWHRWGPEEALAPQSPIR